jgi:mycoredoxin
MADVEIYGTDWCEDTQHTRAHLRQLGVEYRYINIEQDQAAADWVKRQNDGEQKTPTVKLPGLVLSVPSDGQLNTAMRAKGITTGD